MIWDYVLVSRLNGETIWSVVAIIYVMWPNETALKGTYIIKNIYRITIKNTKMLK